MHILATRTTLATPITAKLHIYTHTHKHEHTHTHTHKHTSIQHTGEHNTHTHTQCILLGMSDRLISKSTSGYLKQTTTTPTPSSHPTLDIHLSQPSLTHPAPPNIPDLNKTWVGNIWAGSSEEASDDEGFRSCRPGRVGERRFDREMKRIRKGEVWKEWY